MGKAISAWAFIGGRDNDWPLGLAPYGNGHEAQFPIFPTRSEAMAWKRRNSFQAKDAKLVLVTIHMSSQSRMAPESDDQGD